MLFSTFIRKELLEDFEDVDFRWMKRAADGNDLYEVTSTRVSYSSPSRGTGDVFFTIREITVSPEGYVQKKEVIHEENYYF